MLCKDGARNPAPGTHSFRLTATSSGEYRPPRTGNGENGGSPVPDRTASDRLGLHKPDNGPQHLPIGHPAFRLSRILVPTDFSNRSKRAALDAAVLARRFDSELTVLHVHRQGADGQQRTGHEEVTQAPDHMLLCPAAAAEKLDAFQRAALRGICHTRLLLSGRDPARPILDWAHRHDTDLILMPTYGTGPFRKLILGSVTESVLREAACPVWTSAHRDERLSHARTEFRRIVCAVDRDSRARRVIEWARDFARIAGAAVTVVHAVARSYRIAGSYWSEELRRDGEAALRRRLDELGVDAGIHVEIGDVTQVVTAAIENLDADLLVIGRNIESAPFGSIVTDSYSLIRHARCPVVSV